MSTLLNPIKIHKAKTSLKTLINKLLLDKPAVVRPSVVRLSVVKLPVVNVYAIRFYFHLLSCSPFRCGSLS